MSYVGNKPAQTTIPADDSVTTAMLKDDAVTSAKIDDGTITSTDMAVDPRNASNLNAGDVPLAQLDNVDTSGIVANQDDIALLGFKVAANGSLAKYNLVDQTVDDFQDTSGVDASASTNEIRDGSGKYYSGVQDIVASGGNAVTVDGEYTVHKFTSDGTFTIDTAVDVEYLVVAGGGGGGGGAGGSFAGGGGGAGGYLAATGFGVTATSYSITVGSGGAGRSYPSSSGTGGSGGNSIFSTITSDGGGGGGDGQGPAMNGAAGGSGGGGGGNSSSTSGGAATAGQGNNGGSSTSTGGAGGGSSNAVGNNGSGGTGGAAGAGTANDIIEAGTDVYYAAGGAGGSYGSSTPVVGAANTGNGGGGAKGSTSQDSTAGGSGIVVIRRPTGQPAVDMTLVSTTTAAQAAPTKGDIVLTYTNGAGTTTLDTDLTAEISADGGSTWTALALGSEGSTGSHNIATSHDVTITSTITSPWNMAYRIKTLNQAADKVTRIQAVSLGWS